MRIGMGVTGLEVERRAAAWGGAASYTDSLVTSMRRVFPQHEFHEVSFALDGEWIRNPLRHPATSVLAHLAGGFRFAPRRIFQHEFDLFHALDHKVPALTVPVVATIHDAKFLSMPHLTSAALRRVKSKLFIRKCRLADRVIAISNYCAQEILAHIGIDPRKIDVVYEGVASHIVAEAEKPLDWRMMETTFSLRPGYIAYCGRIARTKNILRLISAFLSMPSVLQAAHPLILIGNVTADEGGRAIEKRVRDAEREGNVRWLGGLPNAEMARVVHHASVFAFPSLHEGFGLPVLEAMYLGVPVLTSNATAMPEVAGSAALLVQPESVEQISNGLQLMIADESLRADLSRRGRARAKRFTWERCAEQTFDVYKRMLSA